MINAQNRGTTPNIQTKTIRLLSFAVTLLLVLAWFLVMPTSQLFAADAVVTGTLITDTVASDLTVADTPCVVPDDTAMQEGDSGEPACEAREAANSGTSGDTTTDTDSDTVIGSPDSPIILDDTYMPQLVLQLFMPLASR